MENHIEKLFDLISEKPFEALSPDELQFVAEHISKEEYEMQRSIIAATEELEYPTAVPLALEKEDHHVPVLKRGIPLYQVLIGAACLLIGFFLFSGRGAVNLELGSAKMDFNIQRPTSVVQVIHDTVFNDLQRKERKLPSVKRDTVYIVQGIDYTQKNRMLEPGIASMNVIINEKPKQSSGLSSRNDKGTSLLPDSQAYTSVK